MTLETILSNRLWRLRNLYRIKDAFGNYVAFRPRESQLWLYRRMWWRNLILKARKRGFSTFIGLLGGDRCIFNPGQTMAIIDKTLPDAIAKLDMIRLAYLKIGLDVPGLSTQERQDLNQTLLAMNPLVENSKTILAWANGSRAECSVSYRGGSPNFILVSEFGYIALEYPDRAQEIETGTLESIQTGGSNMAFLESTHKGGRFGRHYKLICRAQNNEAIPEADRTEMDLKFHFFGWWQDLDNALPLPSSGLVLPAEHQEYFARLADEHQIILSPEQQLWWSKKKETLGHDMGAEHPSVPAEAVDAPTEGAIYAYQIAELRAKGRIDVPFEIDRRYPVWTFWDEGMSDYTSIWAIQIAGQDILWLDWFEDQGQPPSHYAEVIRQWQTRYPIAGHFLTHAAGRKTFESAGKSGADQLKLCGLTNLTVLPVCSRVWDGIDVLRELLRRSVFHQRVCARRKINGEEFPSGLDHLEAYRKHVAEVGSTLKDQPVHDEHSHTADAARTFAEAYAAGKVLAHFPTPLRDRKPQRAILPY